MATLTISPELMALVEERLGDGRYDNADEVLHAAISALQRREEAEAKLVALRGLIEEGIASGEAPDGVFERVKQRAGLTPKVAA